MDNKYRVEDCSTLTPRDVGRRFDRVRKLGVNILEGRDDISYWFDNMSEPTRLFVSVGGHKTQKFVWESVELTFGETAYFYCGCGYKARKLYLPPNGTEFKCRKCHNLPYLLASINRTSVAGAKIYAYKRLMMLDDCRAAMARILYKGKYTKKFESFLKCCNRAGLKNIVTGAEELRALIQSQ